MPKRILIITSLFAAITYTCDAQYYYKDIVSYRQAVSERVVLKEQKIRNILVHSFEANREPSPGFFCEKKISKDYRRVETYTKSNLTGKAMLTAYYNDKDQLIKTVDSSELAVATSVYQYGDKGNIISIVSNSHSNDDDFTTGLIEEHRYIYDEKGKIMKMLRTRNQKDTATVTFALDEHGNIIDERDMGKDGKHYYYYYNAKGQLTDIVKFNVVKNKLLPDFLFEYNNAGQLTQMVAVEEGAESDYYTLEICL